MNPKSSIETRMERDDKTRASEGDDARLAQKLFDEEIEGLRTVRDRLGESFERAVDVIAGRKGRVIVSGVGKSGLIAKKLAGTLTSTGSPVAAVVTL